MMRLGLESFPILPMSGSMKPSPNSRAFRCLALVLIALMPQTDSQAATTAEVFPVVPGSEWRYSTGGSEVVRRIVPGPLTFHGTSAAGFQSSVNGQFVDTYWWSASAGLRVHRIDEETGTLPAGIRFQQSLVYAPATLTPGAGHSFSAAYGYADSGMAEPFNYAGAVQGTTQISGPETVTTAAGTFSCFRVALNETWTELGDVVYAGTTTMWLASGVGLVKASDSSGAVLELRSFNIPGSGPPTITTPPVGRTVPAGASVTFTVQAGGTGPFSYQWRKDGQPVPGATRDSLVLTNTALSDAGVYTVEISNTGGKTVSPGARLNVEPVVPATPPVITAVRRRPAGDLEVDFTAGTGKTWQFETSEDLRTWSPLAGVSADGSGTRSLGTITGTGRRFFRLREGVNVPVDLTLPEPGKLYEAGTRLGGELFGFEFTIAPQWKGGLRVNSPWMLFGSDTEPGLILALLGFAGTREQLLQDPSLRDGFEMEIDANNKLFFRAVRPVTAGANNRLSAGFTATGADGSAYALNLEFLVHPNGGFLGFLGLTTQAQIAGLQTQLLRFVEGAKTPARNTNTDYLNALPGRSFKWESSGNEWYSGNWQGSASSTSWSESYAFFCSDGSFEINKESTSYVSSRNSGGWSSTHMSLSYGSSTKEYGQFTVIQHPQHGNLMLIATLAGYQVAPVQFQPNGSLLLGKNQLVPHERFNCAGP
jgi:hypothetical protein